MIDPVDGAPADSDDPAAGYRDVDRAAVRAEHAGRLHPALDFGFRDDQVLIDALGPGLPGRERRALSPDLLEPPFRIHRRWCSSWSDDQTWCFAGARDGHIKAMALTGILLVGGASTRFHSPKALAELGGETLAARAWRLLGKACDERIAVGKAADGLDLGFPLVDERDRVASAARRDCRGLARFQDGALRGRSGGLSATDSRGDRAPRQQLP